MIAITVPFFYCDDSQRADIMSRVFKHLAKVPDSITIGVGSEGEISRELLEQANPHAEYREWKQYWAPGTIPPNGSTGLRRKYNAAVQAAREFNPEYVFALGSDDLVPIEFFTPADADLIGEGRGPTGGAYFWELDKPYAYFWNGHSRFNPNGRFSGGVLGFSPKFLDALDWAPFQFDGDEVGVEKYALEAGFKLEARFGMPTWHPKCASVLNSMDLLKQHLKLTYAQPAEFNRFRDYWDSLGERPD